MCRRTPEWNRNSTSHLPMLNLNTLCWTVKYEHIFICPCKQKCNIETKALVSSEIMAPSYCHVNIVIFLSFQTTTIKSTGRDSHCASTEINSLVPVLLKHFHNALFFAKRTYYFTCNNRAGVTCVGGCLKVPDWERRVASLGQQLLWQAFHSSGVGMEMLLYAAQKFTVAVMFFMRCWS